MISTLDWTTSAVFLLFAIAIAAIALAFRYLSSRPPNGTLNTKTATTWANTSYSPLNHPSHQQLFRNQLPSPHRPSTGYHNPKTTSQIVKPSNSMRPKQRKPSKAPPRPTVRRYLTTPVEDHSYASKHVAPPRRSPAHDDAFSVEGSRQSAIRLLNSLHASARRTPVVRASLKPSPLTPLPRDGGGIVDYVAQVTMRKNQREMEEREARIEKEKEKAKEVATVEEEGGEVEEEARSSAVADEWFPPRTPKTVKGRAAAVQRLSRGRDREAERNRVLTALRQNRKRSMLEDNEQEVGEEENGNAPKRKKEESQGVKRSAKRMPEEPKQKRPAKSQDRKDSQTKARDERAERRQYVIREKRTASPRKASSKRSAASAEPEIAGSQLGGNDVVMKEVFRNSATSSSNKKAVPESSESDQPDPKQARLQDNQTPEVENGRELPSSKQTFQTNIPVYSPGMQENVALRRRVPLHSDPSAPLEMADQLKSVKTYSREDIEHDRQAAEERVDYLLGGSDGEEEEKGGEAVGKGKDFSKKDDIGPGGLSLGGRKLAAEAEGSRRVADSDDGANKEKETASGNAVTVNSEAAHEQVQPLQFSLTQPVTSTTAVTQLPGVSSQGISLGSQQPSLQPSSTGMSTTSLGLSSSQPFTLGSVATTTSQSETPQTDQETPPVNQTLTLQPPSTASGTPLTGLVLATSSSSSSATSKSMLSAPLTFTAVSAQPPPTSSSLTSNLLSQKETPAKTVSGPQIAFATSMSPMDNSDSQEQDPVTSTAQQPSLLSDVNQPAAISNQPAMQLNFGSVAMATQPLQTTGLFSNSSAVSGGFMTAPSTSGGFMTAPTTSTSGGFMTAPSTSTSAGSGLIFGQPGPTFSLGQGSEKVNQPTFSFGQQKTTASPFTTGMAGPGSTAPGTQKETSIPGRSTFNFASAQPSQPRSNEGFTFNIASGSQQQNQPPSASPSVFAFGQSSSSSSSPAVNPFNASAPAANPFNASFSGTPQSRPIPKVARRRGRGK